jgi:hypothetical protein
MIAKDRPKKSFVALSGFSQVVRLPVVIGKDDLCRQTN